jgi:VanZ family protein
MRILCRIRAGLRRWTVWALIYLCWFAVLCVLSSLPGSMTPPAPLGLDKVEHFCYFCAGGLALGMCLRLLLKSRPHWQIGVLIVVTGAAVGWLDEWHQSFTPGRYGLDFQDWCADVLGNVAAAFLLPWFGRKVQGPPPAPGGAS